MTVYKALKPEAEKAATLAVDLVNGKSVKGDTTVDTKGGAAIQSFLLVPIAVTADKIESTVVADGFYKAADICTAEYKDACEKAGIK